VSQRRHPFALTTPCNNCPFRTDVRPYLRRARIEMLERDLERGTFNCHKTVKNLGAKGGEAACAGSLILLEKLDRHPNIMRIATRLGLYDRTKLDMDAPVYESFEAMADAQEGGATRTKTKPTRRR
jgi:hypothetical protein